MPSKWSPFLRQRAAEVTSNWDSDEEGASSLPARRSLQECLDEVHEDRCTSPESSRNPNVKGRETLLDKALVAVGLDTPPSVGACGMNVPSPSRVHATTSVLADRFIVASSTDGDAVENESDGEEHEALSSSLEAEAQALLQASAAASVLMERGGEGATEMLQAALLAASHVDTVCPDGKSSTDREAEFEAQPVAMEGLSAASSAGLPQRRELHCQPRESPRVADESAAPLAEDSTVPGIEEELDRGCAGRRICDGDLDLVLQEVLNVLEEAELCVVSDFLCDLSSPSKPPPPLRSSLSPGAQPQRSSAARKM